MPNLIYERSFNYQLLNLELNRIICVRLRTPNEAADLNYDLRHTNQRWIPAVERKP